MVPASSSVSSTRGDIGACSMRPSGRKALAALEVVAHGGEAERRVETQPRFVNSVRPVLACSFSTFQRMRPDRFRMRTFAIERVACAGRRSVRCSGPSTRARPSSASARARSSRCGCRRGWRRRSRGSRRGRGEWSPRKSPGVITPAATLASPACGRGHGRLRSTWARARRRPSRAPSAWRRTTCRRSRARRSRAPC